MSAGLACPLLFYGYKFSTTPFTWALRKERLFFVRSNYLGLLIFILSLVASGAMSVTILRSPVNRALKVEGDSQYSAYSTLTRKRQSSGSSSPLGCQAI